MVGIFEDPRSYTTEAEAWCEVYGGQRNRLIIIRVNTSLGVRLLFFRLTKSVHCTAVGITRSTQQARPCLLCCAFHHRFYCSLPSRASPCESPISRVCWSMAVITAITVWHARSGVEDRLAQYSHSTARGKSKPQRVVGFSRTGLPNPLKHQFIRNFIRAAPESHSGGGDVKMFIGVFSFFF